MRLPRNLIRLGFYLLYNHLAFTYDLVAWLVSFGQWPDWRRTALKHLQPGHTLELAYGTGGLFTDMSNAGLNPIGIDISPYMAQITVKKLRQNELPVSITQAMAQGLPFPDNHFRNAVATFPTPYIFEAETLSEIHRVLVTDADTPSCLIIVMQGKLQGTGPLRTFLDWLYAATGERDPLAPNPIAILAEAGFEAVWETTSFHAAAADLIVAQKV